MRSYNDLVNDVRAFLNRKDLDSEIPRFIMLAEQDSVSAFACYVQRNHGHVIPANQLATPLTLLFACLTQH